MKEQQMSYLDPFFKSLTLAGLKLIKVLSHSSQLNVIASISRLFDPTGRPLCCYSKTV